MRDFTKLSQQENEVLQHAYTVLTLRGISAEEDADGAYNGELILKPFINDTVPLTFDGIISVVNQLVTHLRYTSKEAKEFNQLLATMTADEGLELQNFFDRRPLTGLGSREGFLNAILLVEWCRKMRVAVDFNGLSAAVEAWRPG